MGLDAYVYRNPANLPFDPASPGVSIDPETGLIDLEGEMYQFKHEVVALHHRLGNMAAISQLRSEIHLVAQDRAPILMEKVVYEGAHCGDYIPLSQMDLLEQELELLAETSDGSRSAILEQFIHEMIELVSAARTERNPIYFG